MATLGSSTHPPRSLSWGSASAGSRLEEAGEDGRARQLGRERMWYPHPTYARRGHMTRGVARLGGSEVKPRVEVATAGPAVATVVWPRFMVAWKGERWTGRRLSVRERRVRGRRSTPSPVPLCSMARPRPSRPPPFRHWALVSTWRVVQSWGSGGTLSVTGGRGKEAEAETEIYAQGNPGVKKLSPEHCLVLVLGTLYYCRPRRPLFLYSLAQKLVCLTLGSSSTKHGFG